MSDTIKITEDEIMSLDEKIVKNIVLVSKDDIKFEIECDMASISKLIKMSVENDDCSIEVPVPAVSAEILSIIIEYMKHHNGTEPAIIEKPLRFKEMKDVCNDRWDAEFIDSIGNDRQKLYDLILASNYMDINSLLHLGCAKVASLIKGEPLEKIKEILAVSK